MEMDAVAGREALSIDEAAARLGISRGTMYALFREGRGPKTVKLRRRRVVLVDELRRWIRDREREYGDGGQS